MSPKTITRRRFLRVAGTVAGASLLASCAPAPTPTSAAAPGSASATNAPVAQATLPPAAAAKEVKLVVWVQAGSTETLRAENAVTAAEALNKALEESGTGIHITVEAVPDSAAWGDYKKKFTMAADAGQAPDIVLSGHEDCAIWSEAGYIVPLDSCIADHTEYEDVIPNLWNAVVYKGKRWAVPQDTEARPMFFSITKLKEYGWSDAQIAELPKKIEVGEFTLDDMIALAKDAIAKGVVEKGYGYWHRPLSGGDFVQYYCQCGGRIYDDASGKLVVTKAALKDFYSFQRRCVTEGITPEKYLGTDWTIWHDTVSNGKALFFNGGVWQWSDWAANYAGKTQGGRSFLEKTIGYALQPNAVKGKPGATLSHPLVYMVTSKQASGKDNQDLACQLIAKMTTTALANAHSLKSTHLAILKSQLDSPDYKAEPMLSGTAYMVNYAFYQPNQPMYGIWWDAIYKGMESTENGDKSADEATADVLAKLQIDLGDQLLVE